MAEATRPDLLAELARVPRDELPGYLATCDANDVIDGLARSFAARLDRKTMTKSGIVLQVIAHTSEDSVTTYITWDKSGPSVSPSYDGSRRPARMEWQRLSDAVEYEFGLITLQGVGLTQRFSMGGSPEELRTIFEAEEVPEKAGKIIRSLQAVKDMSDRQREKALRGLDIDALLLEQQQATNEALRIFNLLDELAGRVIEWRVTDNDKDHVVQSIYADGDYRIALGETVTRDAMLHFLRLQDFAQFLNGKTSVPKVAMEGHLKVDGDFHLLEILGRIPEPFDPVERWATV